ncbi:MAG: cytochrome c [Pirellulales bacterium]
MTQPFKSTRNARFLVILLAGLAALSGCGRSEPARYHLNMVEMTDKGISAQYQVEIATILEAMFGTPDEPFVLPETGLDINKLRLASGPAWSDEEGTNHGLYRRHCAHCHGVTGDGAGPTALFLNPYPRDYRQGKFKFKSTERAAQPTAHDLREILRQGIPGTAMPSFRLHPSREIDALVEYVKYLSMRGQMETALANFVMFQLGEGESLSQYANVYVDELLSPIAEGWAGAEDQVIHPDPQLAPPPRNERDPEALAASIAKGRELFYGTKANCLECHGPTALGDGMTTDQDDWSKAVKQFAANHDQVTPVELGALPPRDVRPRNLRLGVFRGGRRPIDIYRRLHAGINGTPMPAVGPATPGATGTVTPDQIWNLVDYVLSLPYDATTQEPALLSNVRERL